MIILSLCFSFFQCKRRFERDCKEADRAQQYFEKMDADINVTKADVEKVCVISLLCSNHQAHKIVLYPFCRLPGSPHPSTLQFPSPFSFTFLPPTMPTALTSHSTEPKRQQRLSDRVFDARDCV